MSSTPSYHLLCVVVAPASLAYILTRPDAAHFSIVACHDLAEAKAGWTPVREGYDRVQNQ